MPWKVKFFQIARGDYPVKEFIKSKTKYYNDIYIDIYNKCDMIFICKC